MPTSTTVNNLKINKLTKTQYDDIQNPSETELYLVEESIDTTPTSGSENLVTSGGIYTALQGKADAGDLDAKEDKVDIESATGATLSAQLGKYYTLKGVETLEITLPTISAETTLKSVTFFISTGGSPAVTFVSENNVIKSAGFLIESDSTYEVIAIWNSIGWVLAQVKIDYTPPLVNITTKSTGGVDAAITVTVDNTETDIVYKTVQNGNYWDNDIVKVMYSPQGYTGWTIFAETDVIYNGTVIQNGSVIRNWAYGTTVTFNIYY